MLRTASEKGFSSAQLTRAQVGHPHTNKAAADKNYTDDMEELQQAVLHDERSFSSTGGGCRAAGDFVLAGDRAEAVPRRSPCSNVASACASPGKFRSCSPGSLRHWAIYGLAGRVAESLPLLEQAAERDASMRLVAHQSRAVAYVTCSLLAEENGDQALI
jgi:hypothetical protein